MIIKFESFNEMRKSFEITWPRRVLDLDWFAAEIGRRLHLSGVWCDEYNFQQNAAQVYVGVCALGRARVVKV